MESFSLLLWFDLSKVFGFVASVITFSGLASISEKDLYVNLAMLRFIAVTEASRWELMEALFIVKLCRPAKAKDVSQQQIRTKLARQWCGVHGLCLCHARLDTCTFLI